MALGENRWTEIDELYALPYLAPGTRCFAYYDYDKGGPWRDDGGQKTGHSIIKNLKRFGDELLENPSYLGYRQDAIAQFANEITTFLSSISLGGFPLLDNATKAALVPIPPSKAKTSSGYDVLTSGGHLEVIRRILCSSYPNCTVVGLFFARSV